MMKNMKMTKKENDGDDDDDERRMRKEGEGRKNTLFCPTMATQPGKAPSATALERMSSRGAHMSCAMDSEMNPSSSRYIFAIFY